MHIKALIVDDERLARKELCTLLRAHPDVHVVGEASSIADAREYIDRTSPDVVFLDIRMPGGSGFDLVPEVNARHPHIIFVTAYDAHAVQAFDVDAVDYLLKPVHPERLARAIAKVNPLKARQQKDDAPHLERIYLSDRGRIFLLSLTDITHISGANDYSEVFSSSHHSILDTRTLNTWEEVLPSERFVRIHRSTIVNLDHVERIVRGANSTCLVYLKDCSDAPLKMSRRYASLVKRRFAS